MVATGNETWMLESDINSLRDEYYSIHFDMGIPHRDQAKVWHPFMKKFIHVEFKDLLELVNLHYIGPHPTGGKKMAILKSKWNVLIYIVTYA